MTMSIYSAPLNDMLFQLKLAMQKAGVQDMPEFADYDEDILAAILEEASKFASGELSPIYRSGDMQGVKWQDGKVSTPDGWQSAYQQFCENGWMGLALPDEFGGQNLPKFISQPVNEMWLSANLAFIMFQTLAQGSSEILMKFGTEEQKQRYLPRLTSGEWGAAMALTEPQAGSDLGVISTKAIPQDNGSYLIKGQKVFITYGQHDLTDNIVHMVLARTPDAPAGSRGISLFAVPTKRVDENGQLGADNDVVCSGIEHKLGLHGSPTCSISYGDNDQCFGELIGAENQGLKAMFVLMNEARLSVGMQGVALGQYGYQQALEFASERKQGNHYLTGEKGVEIVQHPDVARMLLSMRSEVFALRSLGYLLAALVDCSEQHANAEVRQQAHARIALLTPVFKAYSTERVNAMAGTAVQVFGGMGFVEETGIAQLMRDARITTIYEGTTAVQAKDLTFRKIIADGGAGLATLLSDISASARQLAELEGWASQAEQLLAAVTLFDHASKAKLLTGEVDLLQVNAGAVSYLEAMGTLCCAWQFADIAVAIQGSAADYAGNDEVANYLALGRFYFAHSLPKLNASLITFEQADSGLKDYKL